MKRNYWLEDINLYSMDELKKQMTINTYRIQKNNKNNKKWGEDFFIFSNKEIMAENKMIKKQMKKINNK